MRVVVAGSRDFADKQALFDLLDQQFGHCLDKLTIISGHARGADKLGEEWATARGVKLEVYPADWDKHGKAAGHIRNKEMADAASHVIAFWDGSSRGTKQMIDYSLGKGLWVKVVNYGNRD